MVSAMNDDDKKATEGTGEKATNGAVKATSAADEANILKQPADRIRKAHRTPEARRQDSIHAHAEQLNDRIANGDVRAEDHDVLCAPFTSLPHYPE
jgi:hypothetical protein